MDELLEIVELLRPLWLDELRLDKVLSELKLELDMVDAVDIELAVLLLELTEDTVLELLDSVLAVL